MGEGGVTFFFSFSFFNKKGFTPQEQINHFELLIKHCCSEKKDGYMYAIAQIQCKNSCVDD